MVIKNTLHLSTFVLGLLILIGSAIAQPSAKKGTPKSESNGDTLETKGGGGKVIEFKQLTLEGTVQKPSAAFLQGRKKIKFKGLAPKKSFISEIKKSVKKYPF